ncbi:MAG: tetratricopeptide repeat protein [Tildeniella torsiva UHER 1998/13D]|jgi:tetratricopeptide (TPR) repeat protein|nr:tetratricopeptide repeat protein [Tildeniella torsiva UHER 1998/13D]
MTLANAAKQIAADPEAQYQALQRSLRRRKGFGLLFVQASPAKASDILQRLRNDLPQKNIGTLVLDQPITNLYNLVAQRPDLANLNILVVQGLEKSLEADIKPGYGGEGDYYNLDTVPPLLSHLNQQRDNFRDHFGHLCFVFVVPPFALKYLIRRAADFFDWQSAIFTFADAHGEERQIQTQISQGEETENSNLQALINVLEGNAKYEAGDYDEAIAAYAAALTLKPDYLDALHNKGVALGNLGQHEAAIACYDAALVLKPDDLDALHNKGVALGNLGQYEAAIACYDAALALKPDYHEALYNKGNALYDLEQYDAAIACYDAALEIKSDYQDALNSKGNALGNLGRYEAAITYFDAVLIIKPDDFSSWDSKGYALAKAERFSEAVKCFDKAIETNPQYANAIYNKAFAVSRTHNLDEALELLQRAIALDPKYRNMARTDTDFDPIRADERFQALVEGE